VIDAATPQKLALRPIQANPNDAFVIPLNDKDGVGAEFFMVENLSTAGNDAEGQAGLLIPRITRTADNGTLLRYELKLPGPADRPGIDQAKRRVAWPHGGANEYVVKAEEDGKVYPVALRNIRLEGDVVLLELGAK
jgi:hypothetical protein